MLYVNAKEKKNMQSSKKPELFSQASPFFIVYKMHSNFYNSPRQFPNQAYS